MFRKSMRAAVLPVSMLLAIGVSTAFAAGSGDSGSSGAATTCATGQVYDSKSGKCVKKTSSLDDRQLLENGKAFAYAGRYDEAVAVLSLVRNQKDAEVLNYLGFATRKSGDLLGGLAYYRKAIKLDPDYTLARSYMGEALLLQGDRRGAMEQLSEIGARCGTGCREYVVLARALNGASTTTY